MRIKILKKWNNKSLVEKKLFFEAYFHLIQSQVFIKSFPFKKIIGFYGLENYKDKSEIVINSDYETNGISWAVHAASKYTPFKSLCLVQALTAQKMLKKRKINGLLFLGVAKDESSKKGLVAHAWLKHKNKIVTGGNSVDKYAIVSTYYWN